MLTKYALSEKHAAGDSFPRFRSWRDGPQNPAPRSACRNRRSWRRRARGAPLQQLLAQITNAQSFDLSEIDLTEYRHLDPRWHDWAGVQAVCDDLAGELFDRLEGFDPTPEPGGFRP
ncbi:hypothetical protein [Xanthobacter sp. KR7-225]|uniref:hypothetical protein n=1 Tax=Xanthobacter sp. KR7-225 TaxID=3156613 RepID=UPI0032B437BC